MQSKLIHSLVLSCQNHQQETDMHVLGLYWLAFVNLIQTQTYQGGGTLVEELSSLVCAVGTSVGHFPD